MAAIDSKIAISGPRNPKKNLGNPFGTLAEVRILDLRRHRRKMHTPKMPSLAGDGVIGDICGSVGDDGHPESKSTKNEGLGNT